MTGLVIFAFGIFLSLVTIVGGGFALSAAGVPFLIAVLLPWLPGLLIAAGTAALMWEIG